MSISRRDAVRWMVAEPERLGGRCGEVRFVIPRVAAAAARISAYGTAVVVGDE